MQLLVEILEWRREVECVKAKSVCRLQVVECFMLRQEIVGCRPELDVPPRTSFNAAIQMGENFGAVLDSIDQGFAMIRERKRNQSVSDPIVEETNRQAT